MSKKDRKRREISRRQKEQRRAKAAAGGDEAGAEEADDAAPEDQDDEIKRRAEQKREYEKRKRAKAGGQSPAPYVWGGGVVAVIALALVGGFLFLGGGGDGGEATPAPSATPDPRIAGLPVDRTITIEANDDGQNQNTRFVPNAISGQAGEVIEILVTNVGSVAHNLRFPGADGEYDTPDDWEVKPLSLLPGDTGRVVVKFDEPDSYPFRCSFHPQIHRGTLTLR